MIYLILILLSFLSGCIVGPDYAPPCVEMPDHFDENRLETTFVADEEFFEWWQRFDDDFLNCLLEETAARNFDLRIAIEQVIQARAQWGISVAQLFPDIGLDAIAARSKSSTELVNSVAFFGGPAYQNFFLFGFDAAWEIDLFGGLQRAARANYCNWESLFENAREVQITVLSEVAKNYMTIRALQEKASIAKETVLIDKEELELIQDEFQAGLVGNTDVNNAKVILDTDQAALLTLESTLSQGIYSLANLVGMLPEQIATGFQTEQSIPLANGMVPTSLPSELLRRRPDIRSAERQIAAATEQIGVAVSALFPSITLTSSNLFEAPTQSSNFGWASNMVSNLFNFAGSTWSIGFDLIQPLMDFGKRMEAIRVDESLERQALINYQKTVITALQEVEEALVAYFKEEERQAFLLDQLEADQQNYEVVLDLFQAGLNSRFEVLQSRKTVLMTTSNLADSRQALASNLIAVYKSLGGEWECFYLP